MKKIILSLLFILSVFILGACSMRGDYSYDSSPSYDYSVGGEEYLGINENQFIEALQNDKSSFAMDTSTAAYANIRRMINNDVEIPADSVKIDQMLNYFNYDFSAPTNDENLAISPEIMNCPWNQENKIVSIGIKAKEIDTTSISNNNIVFLLDVSGSMAHPKKLPLVQDAFKLFVDTLDDNDTISIVTYASGVEVRLDGAKGFEKNRIRNIIDDLTAEGSTSGERGIQTAYALAEKHFIQNGNNRVILGTDGDFNVGISDTKLLENFISEKRHSGVYLSVLGFGHGNLKDNKLETLASNGNGNYNYIDSINEARKVLVEEINGTINAIAKDVKTQVTFNPRYIKEYRLIGYENKLLTDDEFEDDETDAGEVGAGHEIVAVYELVLNDDETVASTLDNNWLKVEVRYKDPETDESNSIIELINDSHQQENPSDDIIFISTVIEMGLLLRNSQYKANASYNNIIQRLQTLNSMQNDEYKQEFLQLIYELNE